MASMPLVHSFGDQDSELSKQTNPITLTRFLLAELERYRTSDGQHQHQQQRHQVTGDFTMLLQSVQLAAKVIANACRRAGIANLHGVAGEINSTGDVQKKLDVLANDVLINCLKFSNQCYIIGSEEAEEPIIMDETAGGYAIVFDPLDGSSNIDCNLSIGTIFGIYQKDPKSTVKPSVQDLLKPGNRLVAAGYAMYDAATMLVLTTGHGVNGFLLDPSIGEFVLTHPDIRIPEKGKIYSTNEGNCLHWDEPTKEYINNAKLNKKSLRYAGSMVGDVHRTLLYGGIFCYPGDKKSSTGKLRLLYECNPMAMIVEQAGGKASTGVQRILDIVPDKLHQRCPVWLGSKYDVEEIEQLYKKHNQLPGGIVANASL